MLVGSDLRVAKSRSEIKKTDIRNNKQHTVYSNIKPEERKIIFPNQNELSSMKKGYQEMAAINLALSNLYFQVESEAQSYYDRVVECEKRCK